MSSSRRLKASDITQSDCIGGSRVDILTTHRVFSNVGDKRSQPKNPLKQPEVGSVQRADTPQDLDSTLAGEEPPEATSVPVEGNLEGLRTPTLLPCAARENNIDAG